jgi:ATP-dependent RNA circularization protein (DNA/RNA ligase family)
MKEYHKIETLLDRDEKFKVIFGKWRLPEFEYLKNNKWIWTEKIDGTNIRVRWIPELGLDFRGKTDNAQMPPFLSKRLGELFTNDKMRDIFPVTPVCLYGEGFGAKIQSGGKYIQDGCDFILFDIKIGDWWLDRENIEDIANKLNIKIVPIIGQGNLNEAIAQTKEGFYSTYGTDHSEHPFIAEGIVLKPPITLFTRKGERLVGKIKTKDF